MLTSERKAMLLDLLAREGRIVAKPLSVELGLSEDTLRRDLRELAADGLLQRVHGGALPVSPALADLAARKAIGQAGKARIARAAIGLIAAGQTLAIDGGSTAILLAQTLPHDLDLTVYTHSPDIASALVANPGVTVELIGGRVYRHSNVAVGALAHEAIRRIRTDLFFMGVTGVHPEFGLTTGDREEAAIKRAFCEQAAETAVLASSEKLGAVSPCEVVELSRVSCIVVEKSTPPAILDQLQARGANLVPV